jgi:hypothetical protein
MFLIDFNMFNSVPIHLMYLIVLNSVLISVLNAFIYVLNPMFKSFFYCIQYIFVISTIIKNVCKIYHLCKYTDNCIYLTKSYETMSYNVPYVN